jgi:CSLREA domain-containing protein
MFTPATATLPPAFRLLLFTAALSSAASAAAAATFVVNSTLDAVDAVPGNGVCATAGGTCTLRAAVQEANALGGAHSITLPAGTYTLTLAGREESSAATGDLNIASGRDLTVNGAGMATTTIDANGIDRAFRSVGGRLTLNDLTVRNGRAEGTASVSGFGGCFYMSSAQLTLTRMVVTGCSTGATGGNNGGGIAIFGSTSMGVSTLTVADSTIAQNSTPGPGGGLYLSSGTTATVTRSTVSGNSATYGGGVFVFGDAGFAPSTVTITESTIVQNVSTTLGGGGVYILSSGSGNSALTVANTTITGNIATTGAGGGILMGLFGGVALTNVTIAANSSATGGAVARNAQSGPMTVQNTIIANNTGAAPANCASAALTGLGSNLEFPGTSCGFNLVSDRRADPLLGPLASNGGPTQTMALLPFSPAIDAGDFATCFAAPVSDRDQRGVSRSVGAGGSCDIGAFESSGSVTTPLPPTNLIASSVVGTVVTLRWIGPSAGPAPTGYILEGGIAPGQVLGSIPTGGVAPTFTFNAPSGSFYLRVHTLSGGARSGPSNEILVHVNVPVIPSPPANLLGMVNGSAFALAWTNTYAGGAPTSVTLNVSGALSGSVPLGLTDSFSFAGVPPGTYTFSVVATNSGGASGQSNAVTLSFPSACSGVPQTVANFVAYQVGGTLFLSWDVPPTGPAPTGYVLNVTGSFVGSVPMPPKGLSAPVPPGTYTFTVVATNDCGAGAATAPQTVVVS